MILEEGCTILQTPQGKQRIEDEAMMGLKSTQQAEREALKAQADREELVERIAHATGQNGRLAPLKNLRFFRLSSPAESVHGKTGAAFCVIAQGSKDVFLGGNRYRYDPNNYLLTTIELPIVSQVIEASPQRPYLSLRLELDPALVRSVMVEAGHSLPRSPAAVSAVDVSPLDANLLDAVVRLVRLLDSPAEARFLGSAITREIVYRLLMGEQGDRLRHIAAMGDFTSPIAKAIERLREDFDQPIRIDDVAQEVGLSVSSFHHQFKAVTALTPLQFQKQLRLQEARRLMLGEYLDAASTAYRVGYNDASHFNREYKRHFGLPPIRDVERMREAATVTAGL
jgi:AraC-like DNA-binding protein